MKKSVLLVSVLLGATLGCWAVDLPLTRVALFTSGVGYFERQADITDQASVDLQFSTEQINDVIKSLILMDRGGGQIGTVTCESKEPVERVLRTFSVNLADNPDRFTLYNRLRGAEVSVQFSGETFAGRILGVEKRTVIHDDTEMEVQSLTIGGPNGIRSLPLEDIRLLTFKDNNIQNDFVKALETLAGRLDRDKKNITLRFDGKGKRPVVMGYMLEMPVWKTSYRVAINEKKLFLQGWAHVENTTDEDWKKVSLSLLSGRPISFIQNLYDPVYVKRPIVEAVQTVAAPPPMYAPAAAPAPMARMMSKRAANYAEAEADYSMASEDRFAGGGISLDEGGVTVAASQQEAGELFEFGIKDVTLPRQQAALLPIVNAPLAGSALSIYNRSVNAKYPLNGIEFTNTTGAFLMQGPVTVFDDNIYAGDARLGDTPKGTRMWLSYAVDLATDIAIERDAAPEEIVSIKIRRGVITQQRKQRETIKYVIQSKREKARELLLQHPYRHDWVLDQPAQKPEHTEEFYRFYLTLKPQAKFDFTIQESRIVEQTAALVNLRDDLLQFYLNQKVISANVRKTLEKLAGMRQDLYAQQRDRDEIRRKLDGITKDQQRIRDNMNAVAKNSESYAKWERKLSEQEGQIEELQKQFDDRVAKIKELEDQIAAFLGDLNVE